GRHTWWVRGGSSELCSPDLPGAGVRCQGGSLDVGLPPGVEVLARRRREDQPREVVHGERWYGCPRRKEAGREERSQAESRARRHAGLIPFTETRSTWQSARSLSCSPDQPGAAPWATRVTRDWRAGAEARSVAIG